MIPALRPSDPPDPARLARWVPRLAGVRAVVWGDFVLDEYWRCRTRRVSREAPVLVLDYEARDVQLGGAANAARNLAALGARVTAVGWIGEDAAGNELRRDLESAGVDTAGLVPLPGADTIVKLRVTAGDVHTARQQVVRIDRGRRFTADRGAMRDLKSALERATRRARAIVLSDYGYDSVTPERAGPIVRAWRRAGRVVGLDSRYRLAEFRGVTLATPNESEASAAAGMAIAGDRDLARAAVRLRRRIGAEHLLVTRGRDGLTLWNGTPVGRSLAAWGGADAVDVTGAGDAVVATATLALAAGAPPLAAAALANVAGSVAVSRRGAVAVTAADLARALGVRTRRASGARAARAGR